MSMEAIVTYLDNLFASFPETEVVREMKSDLLASMEEKYEALKKEGKTENEAVGIVIAEFGNMDELISQLDTKEKKYDEAAHIVSGKEAESYLIARKHSGIFIGLGVFLLIMAPAIRILITQFMEAGLFGTISEGAKDQVWWRIPFFLIMACGVGIIVHSSLKFNKSGFIKGNINLQSPVKSHIKKQSDSFNKFYLNAVKVSVGLLILSPIALLLSSLKEDNASNYGLPILLTLAGIAIYILIYVVNVKMGYNKLLKK